ncbi:MAG: hypothetical protein IPL79_10000 [Myxococcales bacterium]|nr:hypothetical protein [Myxococcales bacterium]
MQGGDEGMRVVGTIRSIEFHTVRSKLRGVAPRHVAKIELEIEWAAHSDGTEIQPENLSGIAFHGPPELLPRYAAGERVSIVTVPASLKSISSIRPAPLS